MKADRSRSGIALILVLMLVVLTTIIVLAFFGSIKTETSAMRSTVGVQNSRQLADLAVQTVISQIQQATQSNGTRTPGTYSWASQPGMIRTYDNTGAETEWYKLYSAQSMTVANPNASLSLIQSDLPETTGTAGNWATAGSANYGVFTDLNSPVTASDGTTLEYPIMNPASATSIAKAAGTTSNAVLGFDIDTSNDPGFAGGTSSAINNQAPMPVRWLYVLQDGTLVPGVASGTPGVVKVAGASSTTAGKQIVGRVAFWTDDETCKLNVNTAGDGSYFDTPRFESAAENANLSTVTPSSAQDAGIVVERQLARTPPLVNEYQRYVGHPAQTRLSYVLGNTVSNSGMMNRSHLLTLLTPFLQWGGSDGGVLDTAFSITNTLTSPTRQTPYATLDEWMFSTALSSNTRVRNPGDTTSSPAPLLSNTRLQQLRFFLSANSDAPEVNLYGQPRISMWPVYTGSTTMNTNQLPALPSPYVTTFDQLMASAATLTGSSASPRAPGNTPNTPYTYYFGRNNAASPTFDWSGPSGNPMNLLSASGNTRNQNIFAFLRTLATNPVPGYGLSFKSKYSSGEMDQILTEIFDYCRCINPDDTLLAWGDAYAGTGLVSGASVSDGGAQVTPIVIKPTNFANQYGTKGFGRFDSINEVSLDFTNSSGCLLSTGTLDPSNNYITAVLYISLFCPSEGYPVLTPHLRVVVQSPGQTGTITFPVTGTTSTGSTTTYSLFGSPNNGASGNGGRTVFSAISTYPNPGGNWNGWNNGDPVNPALPWGGVAGSRQLLLDKYATTATGTTAPYSLVPISGNYQLCGVTLKIPVTTTTLSTSTNTPLEILLYHTDALPSDTTQRGGGDGYPGLATDLVQDITVQLPPFSVPVPTNQILYSKTSGGVTTTSTYTLSTRLYNSAYCAQMNGGPPNVLSSGVYIMSGDVVQSLEGAYNGDLRLIAAQQTMNDTVNTGTVTVAPSPSFTPHPYYNQTGSTTLAHSQVDIFPHYRQPGYSSPGTGQLVPTATYNSLGRIGSAVTPNTGFIDATLAGKLGSPDYTGDWDNGIGAFEDGPFINKPDEAGFQYVAADSGWGSDPYYLGGLNGTVAGLASPNRMIASPVMFGSLPTGVPIGKFSGNTYTAYLTQEPTALGLTSKGQAIPWQTLLFRPQAGHYGGSNGGSTIEDEQILDWFWMPVIEPYAISTTFDTAGKVNMNYQIAPFTYLTRATALMSALGSEYVISVPTSAGGTYKGYNLSSYPTYRSPVKVLEDDGYTTGETKGTLRQFKDRFSTGEIFRSAAEICDIYLEPQTDPSGTVQDWTTWAPAGSPSTSSSAEQYWANEKLTGDNTRERPYNGLYSRLTTKSNTYTVHVRAQSLKAAKTLPDSEWIENPQQIVSEYRGSVTVNRYLDPQDTNIPDFMTPGTNFGGASSGPFAYTLDNYYKYRVLETRQFLP